MRVGLPNEAATIALAQRLAPLIERLNIVYLQGDLGAGKTTFTRALLRAMGHEGAVKSPTYTLVEPYEINGRAVYHFDLYRLADPEELEYLGFEDYLGSDALCLIEWPVRGQGMLPAADLDIALFHEAQGRRAELKLADRWQGTAGFTLT
jgi:tRNA threonylcarbamoyladenosine biosynthesis protein TsaE